MRTTFASLMVILGIYFVSIAGTVIVVRTAGHTSLFKLLDTVTGYLPVIGPVFLLVIGLAGALKRTHSGGPGFRLRLILILALAAVPFVVHMATFALAYSAGTPPLRTMWGPLSLSEWFFMVIGCALVTSGILMLLRLRDGQMM